MVILHYDIKLEGMKLSIAIALTYTLGSFGGVRGQTITFLYMVMLHIKLEGMHIKLEEMKCRTICKQFKL